MLCCENGRNQINVQKLVDAKKFHDILESEKPVFKCTEDFEKFYEEKMGKKMQINNEHRWL